MGKAVRGRRPHSMSALRKTVRAMKRDIAAYRYGRALGLLGANAPR